MDQNKTAYEAFLCMLDTAEEKDRKVTSRYSESSIVIDSSEEDRKLWNYCEAGRISVRKYKSEIVVKKRWYGDKTEKIDVYCVEGQIKNFKDKLTFEFSVSGKDVYDEIISRIKELEEKKKLIKEQSLKDLLC